MRKVVATAVGFAAGAFALGAALAGGARREEREPAPVPRPVPEPGPMPLKREPAPLLREPPPEPPRPRVIIAPAADDEFYVASVDAPFGPYHGGRRPQGMPTLVVEASGSAGRVMLDGIDEAATREKAIATFRARFKAPPSLVRVRPVRRASARGAALRPVEEQAAKHGHGDVFVRTIVHLAKTEGEGGTFAVPARNFVATCTSALTPRRLCTAVDGPRTGKGVITAWGVFQWNRDAGRDLKTLDDIGLQAPLILSDWMPWDWSAAEEIVIPINYYAQLWELIRKNGGNVLDAARGVRLWHTGPTRFRSYLSAGADRSAWLKVVDKAVAAKIDRHLKSAGVT